jgi:hypothetical protein
VGKEFGISDLTVEKPPVKPAAKYNGIILR